MVTAMNPFFKAKIQKDIAKLIEVDVRVRFPSEDFQQQLSLLRHARFLNG
jgi:hypothetical protein